MSEIKVNKISPRTACGTTTLGDSGDTFTIPAGVSITNNGTASGFGATGAASWNTTVKTSTFTAVAGEGYFVNTTSGEVDVTLPAGSPGAVVAVKDYAGTWDTNNCIIISNGSEKIGGSTNNATLNTEGLSATFIYIDSTQGWLITDDGLQSVADTNPFMVATGGTITTSGNCKIHTFTGPGTFTVCTTATCASNNQVSYLVVAGGGGGGGNDHGSGGGAGGFRETKSPVTPYTASPLDGQPSAPNRITVTANAFPITVGSGGAGGTGSNNTAGTSGNVSTFSTITSAGGGGGAGGSANGLNGGSGGGGNAGRTQKGSGNTPPVSPPQGSDGSVSNYYSPNYGMGGGGGATATGGPASSTAGGVGGAGATTSINGTPTAFAGGGGGSTYSGGSSGNGGAGGGGKGAIGGTPPSPGAANAVAGTANTGGGGGGGERCTPVYSGGAGGSGIVIIRYKFQ
jgi:hypothetical protein